MIEQAKQIIPRGKGGEMNDKYALEIEIEMYDNCNRNAAHLPSWGGYWSAVPGERDRRVRGITGKNGWMCG